jgi:hypothetical protein
MALDPNIPLQTRGVGPLVNPMEVAHQAQQMRWQRENAEALAEQRRASAEQRQQQTDKLRRDAEREAEGEAAFDELVAARKPGQPMPTGPIGKLYRTWGAERTSAVVKGFHDLDNADLTNADTLRKSFLTRITAIKALPKDRRAAAYDVIVQDYVSKGALKAEEIAPFSDEQLDAYEQQLLTPEQRRAANEPKEIGGSLAQKDAAGQYQTVYTAPEKPPAVGTFEDYVTQRYGPRPTPAQITQARKDYQQSDDRPYRDPVPVIVMTAQGPQLVDRTTSTSRPITDQGGQAVPLPPTADTRNREVATERARPVFDSIAELSERINVNQGLYAKMAGGAAKIAAKGNLDDDVAEYEALVAMFTPMLARMVGHVGVLTQQDVDSVRAGLPNASDSKSLRDRKMARIYKILDGQAGTPKPKTGGGKITVKAPDGSSHTFDTQAQADAFKQLAGIK